MGNSQKLNVFPASTLFQSPAVDPPDNPTMWFKFDDSAVGAVATSYAGSDIINQGSVGPSRLARSGVGSISVSAGGPNGLKYAEKAAAEANTYLRPKTSIDGDYDMDGDGIISVSAHLMGCIFKVDLKDTPAFVYQGPSVMGDSFPILGLGQNLSAGKIVPYGRPAAGGVASISLDYTSATWRVLVMGHDGVNLYAKIDGGAWQSVACGALNTLLSVPALIGRDVNGLGTNMAIAEWWVRNTYSAADRDTLGQYLCGRAGLEW